MSHQVRTHVRTVNGKQVTVHGHARQDDGGLPEEDQERRDRFERRVDRERAPQNGRRKGPRRTPGERQRRKKNGWTRAKGHARKARRLYRRHKVRAAGHAALAVGWAAAYGTRKAYRAAARAWAGRRR